MRKCRELRRIRRELRLQRILPGLTCMAGLFGVAVPFDAPTYGIDEEWADLTTTVRASASDELRS